MMEISTAFSLHEKSETTWTARAGARVAVERLVRLSGVNPTTISATPATIDVLIGSLRKHWRSHGFKSQKAFQNFASLVRAFFQPVWVDHSSAIAGTGWPELRKEATKFSVERWHLASFDAIARRAKQDGLLPSAVDSAWIARKLKTLNSKEKRSLSKDIVHWNHLADLGLLVGKLEKPSQAPRRLLTAQRGELSNSLQAEIDTFVQSLRNPLLDDGPNDLVEKFLREVELGADPESLTDALPDIEALTKKPLSPHTIRDMEQILYRAAGVLIRSGTPAPTIESIEQLLTPVSAARLAAEILRHRRVADSASAHHAVTLLLRIGRRLKVNDELIAGLKLVLASPCVRTPSNKEMGKSRQEMLEQFDSEDALLAWLDMPKNLEEKSNRLWRKSNKKQQAVSCLESAVIADILQASVVRMKNVAGIRLSGPSPNVIFPIKKGDPVRLFWPKAEIKNQSQDVLVDLTPSASRRLQLLANGDVRKEVLRRHGNSESDLLFPRLNGKAESGSRTSLGTSFSKHGSDTGIEVTPHLARSLAVKIVEDHDPGLRPILSQVLGDTDQTVERFYRQKQSQKNVEKYQAILASKKAILEKRRSNYDW